MVIQSRKSNRTGSKSLEAQLSPLWFSQPQPTTTVSASRLQTRTNDSAMIQQHGKRCRWSRSLVNCDRLFMFLHKHNLLLNTRLCALQSSALIFVQSFLERIKFIATSYCHYIIQPSSFQQAKWKTSFLCVFLKNTKQNKKNRDKSCTQDRSSNTVWMARIRQSLK